MAGRRHNPVASAEESYRIFHGHSPKEQFEFERIRHRHSVLAGCGRFVGEDEDECDLLVELFDGETVPIYGISDGDEEGLLSMNEERTQLYLTGGDQSIELAEFGITREPHDFEVLGMLREVRYYTTKTHLRPEDGGTAVYHHVFGGRGRALPMVIYDVMNEWLSIAGGDYSITPEGILY